MFGVRLSLLKQSLRRVTDRDTLILKSDNEDSVEMMIQKNGSTTRSGYFKISQMIIEQGCIDERGKKLLNMFSQ